MVRLYGIVQCDTCRKAWQWLSEQGIDYRFHDLRRDGLDRAMVEGWADAVGAEHLVNRRGQTWRALDPAEREALDDRGLRGLLLREPTLIKRPVIVTPTGEVHVGWNDQVRQALTEEAS